MSKHKHGHESRPTEREHEENAHEQIQILAHRYWEQRGSPEGDSEADWLKAEHEVERQREAAKRL